MPTEDGVLLAEEVVGATEDFFTESLVNVPHYSIGVTGGRGNNSRISRGRTMLKPGELLTEAGCLGKRTIPEGLGSAELVFRRHEALTDFCALVLG